MGSAHLQSAGLTFKPPILTSKPAGSWAHAGASHSLHEFLDFVIRAWAILANNQFERLSWPIHSGSQTEFGFLRIFVFNPIHSIGAVRSGKTCLPRLLPCRKPPVIEDAVPHGFRSSDLAAPVRSFRSPGFGHVPLGGVCRCSPLCSKQNLCWKYVFILGGVVLVLALLWGCFTWEGWLNIQVILNLWFGVVVWGFEPLVLVATGSNQPD